jgi:curved DNA-binding protein CbpA
MAAHLLSSAAGALRCVKAADNTATYAYASSLPGRPPLRWGPSPHSVAPLHVSACRSRRRGRVAVLATSKSRTVTPGTPPAPATQLPSLDELAALLFDALPPAPEGATSEFPLAAQPDVDDTVLRHALIILAAPQRRAACSQLLRERQLVPWVADALDAFPAAASGDSVAQHLVPTGAEEELGKATVLFRALVAALVVLGFPGDDTLVATVLGPEYVNAAAPPGAGAGASPGEFAAESFAAILDVAHNAQEMLGPEATTGNLVDAVMGAIRSIMGAAMEGGELEPSVEVGLEGKKVMHEATLVVMAILPLVTIVVEHPGPRTLCVQLLRQLADKEQVDVSRAATLSELAVVLSAIPPTSSGQLARNHFAGGTGSADIDAMLLDKGWSGHHFLWVSFLLASALVQTTDVKDGALRSLLVALIDEDPEQATRVTGGGDSASSASSGSAATGYRWSRSSPGDSATRVNVTARAAAAAATEAPDVEEEEEEEGTDFDGWKPPPLPPPPPPLRELLGAPRPVQAAPAPAPVKAKGFGGTAKAKPVVVVSESGGDHKADKALLVAAERQFFELLDWYNAHVAGGQYLAIVSARCKPPAPGAACPEPALCDWLPLCCAMFVDGAVLKGGDMEVSLVDGIPALLVGSTQLRSVAMAALRFAVPTTAVKKLTWSDLDWAYESLPSADAAYITARKAGATAVDDVTNAVRVLGIPPSDAGNRAAVRSAYRRAAAQSHPDQSTGDAERFGAVQAAYELLTQRAATAVDTSMREGLTSGTATGYAAWDSSRRSFEGPLRMPASPEDAAASMARFGGLGCAAMVLGNDGVDAGQEQTKFFARRNTFAYKQAAAATEAAAAAERERAKHDNARRKQEDAERELRAAAQAVAQEAAQQAHQAAEEAAQQARQAADAAMQQAAMAAATANAAANAASATAKRAADDAVRQAAASTSAAAADAASAATTAQAPAREFVSRKATTKGASTSTPAPAAAPSAAAAAMSSEMVAFLDELELEGVWRREVETVFTREGISKVSYISQLELEDLLSAGVRRIPARILLKAAQRRVM